jgi:hypothetical protein
MGSVRTWIVSGVAVVALAIGAPAAWGGPEDGDEGRCVYAANYTIVCVH